MGTSRDKFGIFYALTAVVCSLATIFACWKICTAPIDWGWKIDWNCFHYPTFYGTLCVIGFFLQFMKGHWIHTSTEEYIETRDARTNELISREKNNDVLSVLFNSVVWPLVSHLILIPMAIGAAIFYVLMGLVALVGILTPYILSLLLVALTVWLLIALHNRGESEKRYVWLAVTLLFLCSLGGGICYGLTHIDNLGAEPKEESPTPIASAKVMANDVNLRMGPGTGYDKSGMKASNGQIFNVYAWEENWLQIECQGQYVWIREDFCWIKESGESDYHEIINCVIDDEEEVKQEMPEETKEITAGPEEADADPVPANSPDTPDTEEPRHETEEPN